MRPASSRSFFCSGDAAKCPKTTKNRLPETVKGKAEDPIAHSQEESLRHAKELLPFFARCARRAARDRTRRDQTRPKRCILPAHGCPSEPLRTSLPRGVRFPVECQFRSSSRRESCRLEPDPIVRRTFLSRCRDASKGRHCILPFCDSQ